MSFFLFEIEIEVRSFYNDCCIIPGNSKITSILYLSQYFIVTLHYLHYPFITRGFTIAFLQFHCVIIKRIHISKSYSKGLIINTLETEIQFYIIIGSTFQNQVTSEIGAEFRYFDHSYSHESSSRREISDASFMSIQVIYCQLPFGWQISRLVQHKYLPILIYFHLPSPYLEVISKQVSTIK